MAMYAGLPHRGNVAAVRVLGDGFDLAWTQVRALETRRRLNGRESTGRFRPTRSAEFGLGG
jgi:hypothetical protein